MSDGDEILIHNEASKIIESSPEIMSKDKDLIIAHWSVFAPGQSGLYETVKDLIKYENRIPGVLAGMVTPDKPEGGEQDQTFSPPLVTQSHAWAIKIANIHMIHYRSAWGSEMLKPRVFMAHGTIEACVESEMSDYGEKGRSFTSSIDRITNCDATIVFSKRAEYYWKQFDRTNKIHRVTKGIDLERFKPIGMGVDLMGEPAIGYAEVWRGIKHPLHTIYGVYEYFKKNPKARFQPIGASQNWRLWHKLLLLGNFNQMLDKHEMGMSMSNLENWLRGFDMLISPVREGEPSRVHQEALACGTPVISWDTNPFKDAIAFEYAKYCNPSSLATKIEKLWNRIQDDKSKIKQEARKIAEENYDAQTMALEVVDICRKVLNEC